MVLRTLYIAFTTFIAALLPCETPLFVCAALTSLPAARAQVLTLLCGVQSLEIRPLHSWRCMLAMTSAAPLLQASCPCCFQPCLRCPVSCSSDAVLTPRSVCCTFRGAHGCHHRLPHRLHPHADDVCEGKPSVMLPGRRAVDTNGDTDGNPHSSTASHKLSCSHTPCVATM